MFYFMKSIDEFNIKGYEIEMIQSNVLGDQSDWNEKTTRFKQIKYV